MKLATIADKGNALETLKALRHKLAAAIDDSQSGRDISSLSRQLQIVMNQIEELEMQQGTEESKELDNIVKQHSAQRVRNVSRLPVYYDYEED